MKKKKDRSRRNVQPLRFSKNGNPKIERAYAAAHPLCELCLEKGIYTKTEEIHHKLPLSEGGTHDRSNLIALCKPCHARIHAERGDRWHNHAKRDGN